jgi:hypothetical protein
MRTPEALEVLGPKGFRIDEPYTPIEQLGVNAGALHHCEFRTGLRPGFGPLRSRQRNRREWPPPCRQCRGRETRGGVIQSVSGIRT